MRLPFFIAFRYLISKKKRNIINWITGLSSFTITIVSAALIILLSAFNGLESLVVDTFSQTDPQLKIVPKKGQSINITPQQLNQLQALKGIRWVGSLIKADALFTYQGQQQIGEIWAVSANYLMEYGLKENLSYGGLFKSDSSQSVLLGSGIAARLTINLYNPQATLSIYLPKVENRSLLNPFYRLIVFPKGIVNIDPEFNARVVMVPISYFRYVTGTKNIVSELDINLNPNADESAIKKAISALFKGKVEVKDKYAQHKLLYSIMRSEKLATFLVIVFVLLVASFNITGALIMLIIDKRKDTMSMWSMGFTLQKVRLIYLLEGLLTGGLGALAGIFLGISVVVLQTQFGWVQMGKGIMMRAYPVHLEWPDVIATFCVVLTITLLASMVAILTINNKRSVNISYLK